MATRIEKLKINLVNWVCASLISLPKFDNDTDTRKFDLLSMLEQVAEVDPEFLLKISLYVRDDLNIRSTANFILAVAANIEACTPFLKKYFTTTIRLPSDWLDVAAMYMKLPNRKLSGGALPTALRKAMILKFREFDAYQLGKYSRESKLKRLAKKEKKRLKDLASGKAPQQQAPMRGGRGMPRMRGAMRGRGQSAAASSSNDQQQQQQQQQKKEKPLTMKQMVRQLHINKPVYLIMCILGKKYPETLDAFRRSKLNGEWDESRAGQRMKLPVPETWETEVSAKGNKSETWESLIDHRKLPFMAMLRNMRNLILTGVSPRHHRWVQSRLTNEQTVANSRQFPFSFFAAYEAININLEELRLDVKAFKSGVPRVPNEKIKKVLLPTVFPDAGTIARYRAALDVAVKYATVNNVKPIQGSSMVFCSVAGSMFETCKSATGLGGSRKLYQVGVLMGLMCKHMCEQCDFYIFSSPASDGRPSYAAVELRDGAILENMDVVERQITAGTLGQGFAFPLELVEELVRDRRHIDQIVVLSDANVLDQTGGCDFSAPLIALLDKYRKEINPDMLFVAINMAGRTNIKLPTGNDSDGDGGGEQLNVAISGFSDAILRYIAERGDGDMLHYIQTIDAAKRLHLLEEKRQRERARKTAPSVWAFLDDQQMCPNVGCGQRLGKGQVQQHATAKCDYRAMQCSYTGCQQFVPKALLHEHKQVCMFAPLRPVLPVPGIWRTARVFVSSTFLDMHGERDVLAKRVFPELRERLKARRVNLYEVDLRWGVTEEESSSGSSLARCLEEVDRTRPFFVGLSGARYGRVKHDYSAQVPDLPQYDWLKDYPDGRSITELEMHYGGLMAPPSSFSFFYLRSNDFLATVPAEHAADFQSESAEAATRVADLRSRIVATMPSYRVFEYPAAWTGFDPAAAADGGGRRMAGQLDSFAERVISDLWTAFDIFFPAEQEQEDADADGGRPRMTSELAIERNFHETFGLSITRRFCGRDDELQAMTAYADAFEAGRSTSLVVHGPSGAGRSALLAKFALSYQRLRPGAVVLPVFVGASPSSRSLLNVLRFVCDQLFIAFPEAVGPVMPPAHCSAAELRQHFVDVLTNASYSQKRVVLVLDAIERLDDSGAEQPFALEWLPVAPPICVVLSTTTSHCTASALAGRSRQASVCLRPLSMQHRASVVRAFFADYRKKLDESPSNNQMNLLLRKEHSNLPLWLTVACEELRIFGVFERLNDAINQLPGTVPQLLQQTLARLETQHGVALLSRALSFIACCRGGITESDLLRLLAPPGRYALSPVVWNEVFRSLELVFLNPPGAADERYLSLSHQQAYTAIADRYMSSLSARTAPHRELADYYQSLADPLGNRSWQGTATRAFQQLSYHYTYAEMKTELSELLADPVFLAARTLQGQVFELLSDFSLALGYLESDRLPPTFSSSSSSFSLSSSAHQNLLFSSPFAVEFELVPPVDDLSASSLIGSTTNMDDFDVSSTLSLSMLTPFASSTATNVSSVSALAAQPEKSRVAQYSEFVKKCSHVLAKQPRLFFQLAANQPDASVPARDAAQQLSSGWVQWVNKPQSRDQCRLTFEGFSNEMTACAYSPDGQQIVVASKDRLLRVFEVASGKILLTLAGHANSVAACCYSDDGKMIASASWDETLAVWDAETGAQIKTLSGHRRRLSCVVFSHSNTMVLTGSWDCTLMLWVVRAADPKSFVTTVPLSNNNQPFVTFSGHTKPVSACAFSLDDARVVSASWDCTLRVWDARTGQSLVVLSGHEDSVRSVCFSNDNRHVLSGSADTTLRLWDTENGQVRSVFNGHAKPVNAVSISPDGKTVVSGADDQVVKVWDAFGGRQVRMFGAADAHPTTARFINGDHSLVVGLSDCSLGLWDALSGRKVKQLQPSHLRPVASVDARGNLIVTAGGDAKIHVYVIAAEDGDATDGQQQQQFHELVGHKKAVTCVRLSPNGTQIASSSDDQTGRVWSYDEYTSTWQCSLVLTGHSGLIKAIAWSPKGNLLATASRDNTLRLWDPSTGEQRRVLKGHKDWLSDVAFNAKGNRLVTASWDCTLCVWDVKQGIVFRLLGHAGAVISASFSPDDTKVVSASIDQTLRLWNAKNGELISVLAGHLGILTSCAFSQSGTTIVSTAEDSSVRLWDVVAGSQIASLQGHSSAVRGLSWSPDGKEVVSSSADHTIRVWDPLNTENAGVGMNGHLDTVTCIDFSADGQYAITGSRDCTLAMWHLPAMELVLVIKAHKKAVTSCAFATTRNAVITGSDDGTIRVWNVNMQTGKSSCGSIIRHHTNSVTGLALCPGVKAIVSSSWDESIAFHRFVDGSYASNVKRSGEEWLNSIDLAPDRSFVASSHSGHLVFADRSVLVHSSWALCARYSPDHQRVVSGSYDGELCVVSGIDDTIIRRIPNAHASRISACDFSSDGLRVYSAGRDSFARVWCAITGELLAEFPLRAPASSLRTLRADNTGTFAVGDVHGNIELLRYRH